MSMDVALATLFKDFDRGIITRRQLLQALGIAALAVPMNVFGQGSCGGANAAAALPKNVHRHRQRRDAKRLQQLATDRRAHV